MRASIIIPVFNNETTIERLIRSLLDQSVPEEEYEILAVDGGSSDNTLAILDRYVDHENLKVIKQGCNKGIGGGRNDGIRQAKSDILLFIDGDMEVDHNWAEEHIIPIESGRWDGAVGKVEYDMKENTKFKRYLNRPGRAAAKFEPGSPINHKVFVFWNCAIRKKLMVESGMFDEKITTYGGEELEVIYRVENKFPQCLLTYNPKAHSIHYQYRTLERNLFLLEKFGEIVIPFLVEKHPPLAEEFKINSLKSSFLFRSAIRSFTNPVLRNSAKSLFPFFPDFISFKIIRFLLYAQCYKGVLSHIDSLNQ